ncbi:MAG: peptide chain release factor 1 [Micrococcales bacterium]|nr:MAG: peptide chain release factor 1 [Micrococcales bacterium]
MPPVLHRQAEDPGHRRPGCSLPGAVRQEGSRTEEERHREDQQEHVTHGAAGLAGPNPDPSADGPLAGIRAEHADLQEQLADPAVHSDAVRARKLSRRYAQLSALIDAEDALHAAEGDLQAGQELAEADESFAAELAGLQAAVDTAGEHLRNLLIPADPDDARDVILQIKAGEGGLESALFAADLARMYTRYAERRGWRTEVLSSTESDLGGYKDVSMAVKSKGSADEPGVWSQLKFEGGVHRVQRVPVTESQGRIHTSAAGVLVMPEAEAAEEVEIDPNDLRVDVFRSSGPGGQSVNTTDSAVRITHLPSGLVVSCQNEKSQLQNKEQALRILRARLLAMAAEAAAEEAADARRSQVRTVDRSERVRTYNFPENRISDQAARIAEFEAAAAS